MSQADPAPVARPKLDGVLWFTFMVGMWSAFCTLLLASPETLDDIWSWLTGLDHGIWTPLRFMWPAADVPVLPLGWMPNSSPRQLFEMGSALAPLAAQGVLIMATGSITHNLRRVAFSRGDADAPEIAESAAFRRWWLQRSAARDWPALFDYRRAAPHGADMHPSDEHLLPWFVAAGAGGSDAAPLRLHDSVVFGCLGMDDYAFGASAPRLAQALPDATLSTAHR
jgi:4,5-DOPA dioxygenase extradiol